MAIRKIKIYNSTTETYEEVNVGALSNEVVLSDDPTKTLDDALGDLEYATDPFTGTDGTEAGTPGLVPAPAIGDAGKFLSASGFWRTLNSIPAEEKGAANGVATLDSTGKVPTTQLPSYVDDVIEGYYNTTDGKFYKESTYTTEIIPETDKIYVDLTANKTYRWGGSAYVEISESLALGETDSTAYRGDRGKAAYDHAIDANALKSSTLAGLYKIASTSEGHIAALNAVTKQDITDLGIPAQDTTYQEIKTDLDSVKNWNAGSASTFTYDSTNNALVIVPGAAPSLQVLKTSVLVGITASHL